MGIIGPPDPPMTILTSPSEEMITLGLIEDSGRFHGDMKFADDAGTPKMLVVFGVEKSSISLLKMMPVREPTTFEPNLK